MSKKLLSLLLVAAILVSCYSIGMSSITTVARDVGAGTGAESFNPVSFTLSEDVVIGTEVDISLDVSITDSNYKVKINSVNAYIPYYTEGGISYLDVAYAAGTVVTGTESFAVTGKINEDVNSVVRYTIGYDILDKSGNTVWKNLTGYTYGLISSSESHTGAVGTYHSYPGQLSDGCYFESLDTLNTAYVQQSELMLYYKIRTQSAWNYSDSRTRGVNVISGNAPSTIDTMPDNNSASREGQMDWPKCGAVYRSASGRWLAITEPSSGYYNFTISFNSWNDDWEDQSNITETTEMYYITNADKVAAINAVGKMMKTSNAFSNGYYVQKGLYTEESWNNYIMALDNAYQVALSVPNANYGYKLACQYAANATAELETAFASLEEAEHDFYTYKDSVIIEATCTETGSHLLTCICGEEKIVEIPANGHVIGEWNVVKEPTCTEKGIEVLSCAVCNDTIKEKTLGIVAHNYLKTVTSPTCLERGYSTYTCVVCGDSYTTEYVDALGHLYESEVVAPTCTKTGCTVHICYACSHSYTDEYTEKIPHDYVATVVEPTETEEGYTVYQCENCDSNYTDDYVPVLGVGVKLSGTVKSFATNAENTETIETKIELIKSDDEDASYTVLVSGTGEQSYSFDSVAEGSYILRVSKENHATREYEITVSDEEITYELVINLLGDVNGDGRVNTIDTARANAHAKGVATLESYECLCADVNGDGRINTVDVARINAHAKNITYLW